MFTLKYKEVFVKHGQAPTAPKLEGVWFLQILNKFSMKTAIFDQFCNYRPGVFDRNGQKAHLRTKTFHLSL